MLIWVADYLAQFESGFGVFKYLTLRTILSVLTSLFISFLLGPFLIHHLTNKQIAQSIRDDGPEAHLKKIGTPTMGGLLILLSIIFSTLCWADISNRYILVVLTVTFLFGEKNNNVLSILGFGRKEFGLMSQIFFIFNFQLLNIDNLP